MLVLYLGKRIGLEYNNKFIIRIYYYILAQKLLRSARSGSTALSYQNCVITLVGGFHTLYDEKKILAQCHKTKPNQNLEYFPDIIWTTYLLNLLG